MPEPEIQDAEEALESRMVELAEELRNTATWMKQAISDEGPLIDDEESGDAPPGATVGPSPEDATDVSASKPETVDVDGVGPDVEDSGDADAREVVPAPDAAMDAAQDEAVGESIDGQIEDSAPAAEGAESEDEFGVEPDPSAVMDASFEVTDDASSEAASVPADEEEFEDPLSGIDEADAEQIRSLDDELAQLADEMIVGDVSDGFEEVAASSEDEAPAGEAPDDQPTDDLEQQEALRDLEEIAAASEEVDQEIQGKLRKGKLAPELSGVGSVQVIQRALGVCVGLARKHGPVIAAEVRPVVRKACEIVSKPLDGRSPVVRMAVGLIGLTTLMYAIAVLVYVIGIRTPRQEPAPQTDVVLRGGDGKSMARAGDGG